MRYYIVAGEHSGDMHGAGLITQLQQLDPQADFWACGGDAMAQAMGKPCCVNSIHLACMGLDFLKKIYPLWNGLQLCKKQLLSYRPDCVILIDNSGWNMRIAAYAKQQGYRVYYYIPPKIWAHGGKRIAHIKKNVDKVLAILPFEVAYYQTRGYDSIDYVGNPLVQRVANHAINPSFRADNGLDQRPIIALFPGSRVDEVQRLLPIMMRQQLAFPAHQWVIAGLRHIPAALYAQCDLDHFQIVYDQNYDLMLSATVGIVAAGTASLEAALCNLVQVVIYQTNRWSYYFFKSILTTDYISLVNILLNQSAVPELIQYQLTQSNLHTTLMHLLEKDVRLQQQAAYAAIHALLSRQDAACQAAQCIVAGI